MPFLRVLWRAKWRIAVGLLLCYALYFGWWLYSFTKQVNNTIRLNAYSEQVAALRDAAGALPAAFEGHKDYFGRDVVYVHDDRHFILVSYGSDGKPDRVDYPALLETSFDNHRRNCLWPPRDTVVINRMVWQGCWK